MEAKIIDWSDTQPAIDALKRGEVVLFPTETVYGIACIASSEEAYDALREAKGRPAEKPFTLMCADTGTVAQYCEIDVGIAAVLNELMPGELTLLLRARKGVPHTIDLGTGVIGVRVPNSLEVLALIEKVGEPLLVSSANMSGQAPAKDFEQACEIFSSRASVVVRGETSSNVPSTIVDLTGKGAPKLIRQGSLPFEKVEGVYRNSKKTIAIGCDHGGYDYKEAIRLHLLDMGFGVLDLGCYSKASVDYPIYGKAVGEKVVAKEADLGVVICTSGEGISMAANKVSGVRCGIGYDDVVVAKCRDHNNANVISFGQKYMKLEDVLRRVDIFLSVPFSTNQKHHHRVDML